MHYIARSYENPKLIYCTDKDWHPESMVGPNGWRAKMWKTEKGARRAFPDRPVLVEEVR
jgi:hypothetical protein